MNVTETAIKMLERQLAVANRDGSGGTRKVRITIEKNGAPRYMYEGKRISGDKAVQIVAQALAEEEEVANPTGKKTPAHVNRTNFDFDRLNEATRDYFFELADQIKTAKGNYKAAVRIGHDIPTFGKQNQPRVTNLKKAGMLASVAGEVKSHKMVQITDAGRKALTSKSKK